MLNVHIKLKASSIEPPPSPPWVELPAGITMDILQRLGTLEIMESAEKVCSTWWNFCYDPAMWRVVHLKYETSYWRARGVLEKICQIAVDRSQVQLSKISIENFGSKELLNYIAERSSQLRHLRLVKCCGDVSEGLAAAAKKLPLLEELQVHLIFITKEDIESVGRSCSLLKSFILNACVCGILSPDDGHALAIARSMPELRHLALLGNILTNVGLQAILDGCPHLVSLDLHRCNIDLEGDLGRRCKQQILDLKQPHDYEFDSEVWFSWPSGDYEYESSDDYEDYPPYDDPLLYRYDSDDKSW